MQLPGSCDHLDRVPGRRVGAKQATEVLRYLVPRSRHISLSRLTNPRGPKALSAISTLQTNDITLRLLSSTNHYHHTNASIC